MPLWRYMESGGRRAVEVAHRRWGKDDVALHWACVAAHQRVANYWHMLPEYSQARKAIWNAVNARTGKRRIDEAFPPELRARTNDQEMLIKFKSGSTWQVVGSDSFDALVGAGPAGVVFSEWSLANPRAWPILAPMLEENGGWAVFIYTARGRNHGHSLLDVAKASPDWFWDVCPATQTDVFTAEQLQAIEREYEMLFPGHGADLYRQEYLCDFTAAVVGAYYGRLLTQAERDGRITRVPYDPMLEVTTAWDLGIGDSTAIWFVQQLGREVRIIDYYEASGVGLDHYAKVLKERPYAYREHLLPHDAEVKELGTGRSRVETLESLGIRVRTLPRQSVEDGINAARVLLPACWFDGERCKQGLEALRQYRRAYDDKRRDFLPTPLHDWTSHSADAFRYLAMGLRPADGGDRQRFANQDGFYM